MRKINILDFEEILIGIDPSFAIHIKIRNHEPEGSNCRYYAKFGKCEAYIGNSYHAKYGDGKSPKAAIKDYCKKISELTLNFDTWGDKKLEIKVPELFYKK